MPQPMRGRQLPKREDEPNEDGNSSFAWEFVNDERAGQRPSVAPRVNPAGTPRDAAAQRDVGPTDALSAAERRSSGAKRPVTIPQSVGEFGPARANYIRDQLDRALDRWWAVGELPPLALLRDALLLLEAGGSASESQRTLMLRAALAYERGIQTALRHQADAERVALVLAEALVEWEAPVVPERVAALVAGNAKVLALLNAELERSRVLLTGEPRRRAQAALDVLPRAASQPRPFSPAPPLPSVRVPTGKRRFRQVLLVLLLVTLVGFVLWQQRQRTPEGMVAMPAATYALLAADEDTAPTSAQLAAFWVDQFEVTNHDYRRCIEAGACVWPLDTNSATRVDYFTNPAFDGYPVVNVSQAMAATYCAWQQKRLPTAGEWQVAASVSPTTGQAFRYPWGETFEAQRTNSAASVYADTVAVGLFRPAGDSPSGAVDMAGNVAEWTATLVAGSGEAQAVVKGGSYTSPPEELAVGAAAAVVAARGRADVGFRCARTFPASS